VKKDLLSYGSQVGVVEFSLLPMMMVKRGEYEGLCGLCYAFDSLHSMSATCGPRYIISLVTPKLLDTVSSMYCH
jgi:hypothetical protein